MENNHRNGLLPIIAEAIDEMEADFGKTIPLDCINLAELGRRTGISRAKLRRLKANGFVQDSVQPAGKGFRPAMKGYTETINVMLAKGITNSAVCFQHLKQAGFNGSLSTVKRYIADHHDLVPAKRTLAVPQGSRGRRYFTEPGESFQMDWGFAGAVSPDGTRYQVACFAMICHYCGTSYIEFFPNAKQENLFIGMIDAFAYMGIPKYVLTDNMKSVVIKRDLEGHPIWQNDYAAFMKTVGFDTRLCKPRHPFTKGKVERLVRYVKDNFLCGRTFSDLDSLNRAASEWCEAVNNTYRTSKAIVPFDTHSNCCAMGINKLQDSQEIKQYLCPLRRISFDGFIYYDGLRYGVPYSYHKQTVRAKRQDGNMYIYSDDLGQLLVTHSIGTGKHDHFCKDQYLEDIPEEFPTAKVTTTVYEVPHHKPDISFDKFDFDKAGDSDE